jgi:hypothetical protein
MENVAILSFITYLQEPVLTGLKASEARPLGPSLTLPAGFAKIDPILSFECTAGRHDDCRAATRVAVHVVPR